MKKIAIGICGASGAVYGARLVMHLLRLGHEVHCAPSEAAKLIMLDELGSPHLEDVLKGWKARNLQNLRVCDNADFYSPIASGSFRFDAMAVCPCSMKTLGKLANGIAEDLVCRAAEVALKERRRLVVVPRETPLALTHIRNMERLCEAGAVILPPSPAFYQNKSATVEDLVDFVVARICACLEVEHDILEQWGPRE